MDSNQYFEHLAALLKIEKEADLQFFKTVIEQKPLEKRVSEGFTWYPIKIMSMGFTYGEKAFVVLQYEKAKTNEHHFREGNVINLFRRSTEKTKDEVSGVVNYIDKDTMKIILNSDDIPDWIQQSNIGIDIIFDDKTYNEMDKAMKKANNSKEFEFKQLRDKLLGLLPQKEVSTPLVSYYENLNDAQNQAVHKIIHSEDYIIIHGPPGTGKTTTLVHAIKKLVENGKKVLVTAASNTATDLITERLFHLDLNVTRIGNISRIDEELLHLTLDDKLSNHPESKIIKKLKSEAADLKKKANAYVKDFDKHAAYQRKKMYKEARELTDWSRQIENKLLIQILETSDVIASTVTGASSNILNNIDFDTVVIDEAGQCIAPATWIPILKAKRVVLAGDHFQLPPTVKSNEAVQKGLNITLMEMCFAYAKNIQLLNVQYRMHRFIMEFSNRYFYEGALKAHHSVENHSIHEELQENITFIDTAGCGFDEIMHTENKSKYNPEEYFILREHLYQLVEKTFELGIQPGICILSPYKEQVNLIKKEVSEDKRLINSNIHVHTIDGYQGQEQDIVYISLVRSNERSEIGFLSDYRRMNVAMTRARKQLIIIGNSATIGNDKFYSKLLDYVEKEGMYYSAWEYMA
jgi:ATP-dependent RNA/DNA helicase IGHMBP2